jgi:hypothetical protein
MLVAMTLLCRCPQVNIFTIASIGGLSGMFSKNAADKLKEVFDVLFRARQDEQRKDKLGSSGLAITGFAPGNLTVSKPDLLTVHGSGFDAKSVVQVNGKEQSMRPTSPPRRS